MNFTEVVRSAANNILAQTLHKPDSFRLSVHIRHYNIKDPDHPTVELIDNNFMKSIDKLRSNFQNLSCYLYLATEHEKSLMKLVKFSSTIDCHPYFIDRSGFVNSVKFSDHGVFGNGILPFADAYLLQHGDFFIGTSVSSFSHMIASVVSFQALRKGISRSALWWYHASTFDTRFDVEPNQSALRCTT